MRLPASPLLRRSLGPVLLLLLGGSASAQATLRFPLQPATPASQRLGAPALAPDPAALASLSALDEVTLTDVPLPGGGSGSLVLERIDVSRRRFGIQVDGVPAPDALEGLDLSVWRGQLAGDEHSDVMLGFSNTGSRGWIRSRRGLVHLLAFPHEDGSWRAAPGVLVTEEDLNLMGHFHEGPCETPPPAVPPAPVPASGAPPTSQLTTTDLISLRECSIAMETDYQLYQRFNDVSAATSYLTTLLSFISDRYEAQASTILTFPYLQIYTDPNDPWSTPENGGGSGAMLDEFRNAWLGNIPAGASLGHMMSGANLGGGVAYLSGICSSGFNFAVSGNINGNVGFPVTQGPSNWDFMVVAHELGHNFSSPHTHDFCPPLDECAPSSTFGGCQTSQVCTNAGTIMSYCHLCSGGTNNITTYFHPRTSELMTEAARTCLPLGFELVVSAPDVVSELVPTGTSIQASLGTISAASLIVRPAGAAGVTVVPMSPSSGGVFVAELPPTPCEEGIEYWFEVDLAGIGSITAPLDAPNEAYQASGGFEQVVFQDDFEQNLGWGTTTLGATAGRWERGVPVNDPAWAYGPSSDYDLSGQCYLTENRPGSSDVDGGATRLISPLLDMSAPNAALSYAYFLRLTHVTGADMLLVEASSAGGPFVEINRHDTDMGPSWNLVTLTRTELVAAGLTPGPEVVVRFTANDSSLPSVVEAGIDAVTVRRIDCLTVGTVFCDPAVPNSLGLPATVRAEGSDHAAANDVRLTIEALPPNTVGYFLASRTQGFVAGPGPSQGNLCLGGSVGRYITTVLDSGPSGTYSMQLDLTSIPQPTGAVAVVAGETWNFQSWYRDQLLGFPSSNFTEAIEILFQ